MHLKCSEPKNEDVLHCQCEEVQLGLDFLKAADCDLLVISHGKLYEGFTLCYVLLPSSK